MKALLLFFIFSILIVAQDTHDGSWWRIVNNHDRLLYVDGVFSGIPIGGKFSTYLLNETQKNRTGESFNYCYNEFTSKNMTYEQVCEGLDSLYSDYRNLTIPVNFGIWAVLNSIRGISQQDYEELLQTMRKGVLPK